MTEKFFFEDWVGKTIKLTTTNPPSEWKLTTKLSDKNSQRSAEAYHESPPPHTGLSSAITPTTPLTILYRGSEWAIHAERARQASETPNIMADSELRAVSLLRDNNCTAAPRIRTHEATTQDDSMLVPGGYLHYILMDKAGGVQLSEELFWSYERGQRDRIREAYKEAYKEAWWYVVPYVPIPSFIYKVKTSIANKWR
ncbi:hypothetical protein BJX99DRAFT_254507 [Aspergillus californicus]